MELYNFHFANLKNKRLNYNQFTNTYNCPSGIMNHHNYPSCKVFIENLMNSRNQNQSIIIETGTMSFNNDEIDNENSINSTLLFNNIVCKYGGILFSCDINKDKIDAINEKIVSHSIKLINMDSLEFLANLANNLKDKNVILNIYLDTYDKNKKDIENANHCIKEYNIIKPYLTKGSQILINNATNHSFAVLIKNVLPYENLVIDKSQLLYVF
jgi:hypothetical protein